MDSDITHPKIWKLFPNARVNSLGCATEASIWSITFPVTFMNPEAFLTTVKKSKNFHPRRHVKAQTSLFIGRLYIAG
jgi:hypothetical protein